MKVIFGNGKKWFSVESDNFLHAKIVMHEFLNASKVEPIIIDSIDEAKVDEIFYPTQKGDLDSLVGCDYRGYVNDHKLEINAVAVTRTSCDPIYCERMDE